MSTPLLLKPMSAGDILDRAIRIYRENFIPLVTIVAIINVPLILVQVAAAVLTLPFTASLENVTPLEATNAATIFGVASVIAGVFGALGSIFVYAAITAFVSERFLGRPSSVRQAYGAALGRWLSLLIAALLYFLANVTLALVFAAIIFLPIFGVALLSGGTVGDDSANTAVGLVVLCLCVLIIPALLFSLFLDTRWSFWTQAIVIEKYNSTGGLGRSWKLVKGTFWRVLGFIIILSIIVSAFSLGPIGALSVATVFLPSPILRLILPSVASSAIVIIMTPLQYTTLTVLYYDLRIRKEGFDLQMQMQEPPTPLTDLPSLVPGTGM